LENPYFQNQEAVKKVNITNRLFEKCPMWTTTLNYIAQKLSLETEVY